MKHFDMFSGYGGFTIACREFGIETIGFSEIDKYAIAVYKHHFSEVINYGDATRINPENLPGFDLLTAGFPCQAFSLAGKRKGLEDCRGTLFYEIARIVSVKKPKLLLLENIKELLSHDKGKTFGLILSTFSDLGYICEWQVFDSKDFRVPQNRKRVFITGHFGGRNSKQIFPIIRKNNKIFRVFNKQIRKEVHPCAKPQCSAHKMQGSTIKKVNDNMFTLTAIMTHGILIDGRLRFLTPIEYERLMGLEDDWTKYGIDETRAWVVKKIPDIQRYKLCGNGVVLNIVKEIIKRIVAYDKEKL